MSVIDMIPIEQIAVRVKNVSDKDLKGEAMKYANAEYRIPAGGERVMPWLAMCHFFGDPRSVNIGDPDGNRETQFRRGEQERLTVHWGTYDVEWYSDIPITTPGGDAPIYQDWKENPTGLDAYVPFRDTYMHPGLPRVEVYRMDNDERVYTVIEDPAGENARVPDQSKLELKALTEQYNALKNRLDNIANEVAFRDPTALDGPEMDPLDNIPVPDLPEVGAEQGAIGQDAPDQIVNELTDPEVPDTKATEDSPQRPKRKVTS